MSSQGIEMLRRAAQAREANSQPAEANEDEASTACFGYLRGVRDRALEIEFRRSVEGDSISFPYSWLGPTRYHPSIGIQLLFVGPETYLVTIRGRNLNQVTDGVSLYERGILRHRVTWVGESQRQIPVRMEEIYSIIDRVELTTVEKCLGEI